MLAMTSGRASKIINRTPIGHVTLSSSRPSSSLVLSVILLTVSYKSHRIHTPQSQRIFSSYTVVQEFCKNHRTIHQPLHFALCRRNPSPGSSRSRTSSMPCSISSHLPFLPKSSLFSTLWLSFPSSAALVASSRSFALAARMVSLASCKAPYIAVRASFRACVGSTARL